MVPQTDTDRFIFSQVQPMLAPGEEVNLAAYLTPTLQGQGRVGTFVNAATRKAAFAALTERRLIFIETRIGAFAPLLENQGVRAIERDRVKGVLVDASLWIELTDGEVVEYQNNASEKAVSTQGEFFRRLPELFPKSEAAARTAGSQRVQKLAGLAIGVALVGVYLWYRLH